MSLSLSLLRNYAACYRKPTDKDWKCHCNFDSSTEAKRYLNNHLNGTYITTIVPINKLIPKVAHKYVLQSKLSPTVEVEINDQ